MQSGEVYLVEYGNGDIAYVLENSRVQDGRNAWTCKRYKNYDRESNIFYPDRGRLGTSAGGGTYTEDGLVFEDHLEAQGHLRTDLDLRSNFLEPIQIHDNQFIILW